MKTLYIDEWLQLKCFPSDILYRSLQHDLSDSHFNAADTLLSMKNSAMYRAGLNCQSTWTLSAPPLVSDFGPTTVDAQRVKDATQFHNYGGNKQDFLFLLSFLPSVLCVLTILRSDEIKRTQFVQVFNL